MTKPSISLSKVVVLGLSWLVMLVCANNFGSFFGWKEQVEIVSSALDFDRSPKGLVTADIVVQTKRMYVGLAFESTALISSNYLGFSKDDLYKKENREKLEFIRMVHFKAGSIKEYFSNPLFFSSIDIEKPSLLKICSLASVLTLAIFISYAFLGSLIKALLFFSSVPLSGLVLSLI